MDDNKAKKKPVDDAGIRLAPVPIRNDNMNVLPPVKQDFIITPHIEINEPESEQESASSLHDYQPKKEEMSKKWKRGQRGKNIVVGSIVFIISAFAMLPFILGAANAFFDFPFKYVPKDLNAISNFVKAFSETADLGWSGEEVNAIWLHEIPDMLLVVGFLAVAINMLKSLYALFAAVKHVSYVVPALVYLFNVLVVLVLFLIGIESIGIKKIDFMNDIIYNTANSELFTLVITSVGYFIVCFVLNLLSRDKQGYLV